MAKIHVVYREVISPNISMFRKNCILQELRCEMAESVNNVFNLNNIP